MSWISALRSMVNRLTAAPKPESPGWWRKPSAGVYVDENVALTYAAVWICCRVIAESISAMPWHVMQRDGDKRRRIDGHPADWLLHIAPNPELSAYTSRETLLFWALTWGNGYAEIERDGSLRPIAIWPIEPDRVRPTRDTNGALVYEVTNSESGRAILPARDMFHLRGPGWNGLQGYSPIALARESIALGLATEKFGSAFFGNGAVPGGVIEAPENLELSVDAKRIMLDEFNSVHRGPGNYGKVAYLDGGMKYKQISVPPEDAQFLETRQHQVLEICRWYKVPPHKVYELTRATYNNVEQQQIEFLTETLVPWIVRLEQEADAKLLGPYQRGKLYTKIKPEALLRGDLKSRYEAYAVGRQWGWLSINDVRALEDMDPIKQGGDEYLTPLNMREAGSEPEPQPAPATEGKTIKVDAPALTKEVAAMFCDLVASLPKPSAPIINNHIAPQPLTVAVDNRQYHDAQDPPIVNLDNHIAPSPVQVDARSTVNVEAATPQAAEVNLSVAAPDVRVETPVAVTVEAPAPQAAEVTIQNLQAPALVEVRPEINVSAAPSPDIVLQVGEQIHEQVPD